MKSLALALALLVAPLPASATILALDGGWSDDSLSVVGQPTVNSAWTFTIANGARFSLTDCCLVGDVWTLSGDIAGVTTVGVGPNDIRATGSYGANWLNPTLGKFTKYLGAGTYNFSVTGDGGGGLPAGLGLRLDSAIPEPASWAMLIAGFGLIGMTQRRRNLVVAA